jgi:hypothetical protein
MMPPRKKTILEMQDNVDWLTRQMGGLKATNSELENQKVWEVESEKILDRYREFVKNFCVRFDLPSSYVCTSIEEGDVATVEQLEDGLSVELLIVKKTDVT